ncbi:MAG: hypothetical protein RL235_91 [Chlamydiota bacterium]|jgi:hypothetical protein
MELIGVRENEFDVYEKDFESYAEGSLGPRVVTKGPIGDSLKIEQQWMSKASGEAEVSAGYDEKRGGYVEAKVKWKWPSENKDREASGSGGCDDSSSSGQPDPDTHDRDFPSRNE